MFGDLELNTLILVAAFAIVGHIVLVLLSSYVNPLSIVAAGFFLCSPFSTAEEIPGFYLFKYGRIYCTVLIILAGIFLMKGWRWGTAGAIFLAFIAYFVLGGLWSASPEQAMTFKGLTLLSYAAGVSLVATFKNLNDVRFMLRMCAAATSVFVIVIGLMLVANPARVFNLERLTLLGLNSNRIGLETAAALIINATVVFYDSSKTWRLYTGCVCVAAAGITVATGSRGAVGMGALGLGFIAAPLVQRPLMLGTSILVMGVLLNFVLDAINPSASKRLGEVNFDTRQGVWGEAYLRWVESPVFGTGWAARFTPDGRLTGVNYHSMYYQTLVEIGVLGAIFLAITLMVLCAIFFKAFAATRSAPRDERAYLFVAAAFAITPLLHGIVESTTLQGSVSTGLLGIGLGMFDRLRTLVTPETEMAYYDDAGYDEQDVDALQQT